MFRLLESACIKETFTDCILNCILLVSLTLSLLLKCIIWLWMVHVHIKCFIKNAILSFSPGGARGWVVVVGIVHNRFIWSILFQNPLLYRIAYEHAFVLPPVTMSSIKWPLSRHRWPKNSTYRCSNIWGPLVVLSKGLTLHLKAG